MSATVEQITFSVPDISCGHCEMTIREEVGGLSGVKSVEASNQTKTVEVEFDANAVTPDAIRAALAEAGYPAQN